MATRKSYQIKQVTQFNNNTWISLIQTYVIYDKYDIRWTALCSTEMSNKRAMFLYSKACYMQYLHLL